MSRMYGTSHCVWFVLFFVCKCSPNSEKSFSAVAVYKRYCPENACFGNANVSILKCSPCSPCSCEDDCHVFGTCCPDKQKVARVYDARCTNLVLGGIKSHVYVVSGCPFSEKYAEACASGDLGPEKDQRIVAHRTSSGQTIFFKNKFCAYCYGIVNFETLQPNLWCTKNSIGPDALADVTDIFQWADNSEFCSIGYSLPRDDMTLPYCEVATQHLVSRCNVTGLWDAYDPELESACRLYLNPMTKRYSPRYKNIFCYICNGEDVSRLYNFSPCVNFSFRPTAFDIMGMLNFIPTKRDVISTSNPVCNVSSAYDKLERKCKRLFCINYYILVGQQCEAIFLSLAANTLFHVDVLLLPNSTIGLNDDNFDLDHQMFEVLELLVLEELGNVNMTLNDIALNFRSLRDPFSGYTEVEDTVLSFTAGIEKSRLQTEVTDALLNGISYNVAVHAGDNTTGFESSVMYGGDQLTANSNGSTNTYRAVSSNYVTENATRLQLNPSPKCPFIEYDQTSFDIISNWQIRHKKTNVTFNRTQYMVKDAQIFICVWQLDSISPGAGKKSVRDEITTFRAIINIISFALEIAGITGLGLTFLTYCLFSELRSIPGINLMFLVSSLFVAHLAMKSGATAVTTSAACRAVGVLVHFSWLASLAWMSVCSFHMYKVFKTVAPIGAKTNYSILYGYCLFAFGLPFLVVFGICLASWRISGGADIGYGAMVDYEIICFIKSTMVSMITFAVPLAANSLHSCVFLTKAFLSLRKASKLRKALKQKEMNVLSHCLKLSTLTGLCWIVGIVAKATKLDVLGVIFVFLHSCQGIFIYFAFAFNRKTLNLYRKLFTTLSTYSFRNRAAQSGRITKY